MPWPTATAYRAPPSGPSQAIVAVVNGDVVSSGDVENRGRLFALSTGLPVTKEVLDRLRPQVVKQLVDERLRLQEVQRRKVVVSDAEIAEAMRRTPAAVASLLHRGLENLQRRLEEADFQ